MRLFLYVTGIREVLTYTGMDTFMTFSNGKHLAITENDVIY